MILKLMADAGCIQTGSGNTTSLRALAATFVERERFVLFATGRPTCSAREGGEASPVSSG
jgi:hypothetical protein